MSDKSTKVFVAGPDGKQYELPGVAEFKLEHQHQFTGQPDDFFMQNRLGMMNEARVGFQVQDPNQFSSILGLGSAPTPLAPTEKQLENARTKAEQWLREI